MQEAKRAIVSIEPIKHEAYGNCIQVEDGIYLVGEHFIPTHNSEGSSRKLPAFMLGLNPDTKICIGSYAATIARDFNRDVQRIIDTPSYRELFPETYLNGSNVVTMANTYLRNSDVIEMVGRKGLLRVVGRGGSLTSKRLMYLFWMTFTKIMPRATARLYVMRRGNGTRPLYVPVCIMIPKN